MLIYSLLFLLSSNAVTFRRDKSILYNRITIIILLLALAISLETFELTSLNKGIGLFNGLFYTTAITTTFQAFIFMLCAIIIQLTAFYPRKIWMQESYGILNLYNKFINIMSGILNKKGEQYKIIEYPLILLFIITGACFLISSSDVVSIFLSIELQSYGLYLLCTLYRNSELSTSAGLTYFLLGGLSSCFILLGTSLLYINTGTTNLDNFYIINNLYGLIKNNNENFISIYNINYIDISLLIMSIGFLFKISAAPFHFWSPDVYDAIPTIVTTFVAIIAKISILIFLLELVHYTNNNLDTFNWTISLLFSSLLSLIIGTVLGLSQFRIKRLFAYSTISHIGFILLALSVNSLESTQAFIFYIMQYSLSNLNAFIILISIGFTLYTYVIANNDAENSNLLDKNNSPIQLLSQIKGYFYINPVLALSFCITIYSFIGIPPLIGFFAKQMVLSAALDNGYVFLTFIGILTSVIGAVYYLNIIKQIFFYKPDYERNSNLINTFKANNPTKNGNLIKLNLNNIVLSNSLSVTISILTLIILLFITNPDQWLSIATILSIILFNS